MLDKKIAEYLRIQNEKEIAEHESSGKLTASGLGKPLLEQVLKVIGVPPSPFDDYALRLFARGRQVEDWIVNIIEPDEAQKKVEYNNTIGLVDAVIDGVPYEVKSVKSSQWKWLEKQGVRWSHKLQAGLYALAMKQDTYKVIYISADDFRTMEFSEQTANIQSEIDNIISEVYLQIRKGELPAFEAREEWQKDQKYSSYPDWMHLSPEMAMSKLKRTYPEAYKKLKGAK